MRGHTRPLPHLAAILALGLASAPGFAAEGEALAETFTDTFAEGETELSWQSYAPFDGGVVEGRTVDGAPGEDDGIGVLRHEGGGLATVSYAETSMAEDDFVIEADVYCPRKSEARDDTLTGLAFYLSPIKGSEDPEEGGFYRLVCDYRLGAAGFSLAYIGANIGRHPLELEAWPLIEQDLAGQDWRHLEVSVEYGLIDIYMNGIKLNERAIPAERVVTDIANIDAGYAGVYAGHVGQAGAVEARIDGFSYTVR